MLLSNIPDSLETERLILRKPQLNDCEGILKLYGDPKVMENIWLYPYLDILEAQSMLDKMIYEWNQNLEWNWIIETKDDNIKQFIGVLLMRFNINTVFPNCLELQKKDSINLGWFVLYEFWNQGYATEAAEKLINWLLSKDEINDVYVLTASNNKASRKVAEKAGMKFKSIILNGYPFPDINNPKDAAYYQAIA